jgi:hypothetical protein
LSDRYCSSLYFLLRELAVQALQAPWAFQVQVERLLTGTVLTLQMYFQLLAQIDRL